MFNTPVVADYTQPIAEQPHTRPLSITAVPLSLPHGPMSLKIAGLHFSLSPFLISYSHLSQSPELLGALYYLRFQPLVSPVRVT